MKNHGVADKFTEGELVNDCGLIFTPYVNGNVGCHQVSNRLSKDFEIPVEFYSGSKPKGYVNAMDF